MNIEKYYDEMSLIYEKDRFKHYHKLIDEIETGFVKDRLRLTSKVLEVGCGTGLILKEISQTHRDAVGVDLSEDMLSKAKKRGLTVQKADVIDLPFSEKTFDVIYSFKVLSHVPDLKRGIGEMSRILNPNGLLILEVYNKVSLRYLRKYLTHLCFKRFLSFDDSRVFTKFYSLSELRAILPADIRVETVRGAVVISPGAFVFKIPVVKDLFYILEKRLSKTFLSRFAGFLTVICRKA